MIEIMKNEDFDELDTSRECPADLPHAVDNDPPLIIAAAALAQACRSFDSRIVGTGNLHDQVEKSPNSQHNQATGPAINGASMISRTPPRPGSQVLLSLRCMSRLSSDSAKSPIMPALANAA